MSQYLSSLLFARSLTTENAFSGRKLQQRFVLHVAGVPSYMWNRLPNVLQTRHSRKGFVGCLSAVVFNTGTDLLTGGNSDFQPPGGVTIGRCIGVFLCLFVLLFFSKK